MRNRASNRVIKCVFTFLHTCLMIYMFHSSVCIVHALCIVTIQIACFHGDIEVGPDSKNYYTLCIHPRFDDLFV